MINPKWRGMFTIHQMKSLHRPTSRIGMKWQNFALKDLEGFWAERAEELEWFEKWDKVLDDSNKPFFKWFTGGKVNIVHNCLDRHMKTWRKNKLALIWVSEDGKEERTFSYYLPQPRSQPLRQHHQGHGRDQGRPRDHLPAAHP